MEESYMGSIYAQLIILSMENQNLIPKSLHQYTVSDGYYYNVQLRGEQIIAAELDTIAYLIEYKQD